MKIFELETKNGRVFRVAITDSKNQLKRLNKVIAENKKKGGYEVFTRVEEIENGVNNLNDFESLVNNLV